MARYRTLNNDTEINVDGVRLRAGVDGVFDVVAGSRAEQVLLAGGALPVDGSGLSSDELGGLRSLVSGAGKSADVGWLPLLQNSSESAAPVAGSSYVAFVRAPCDDFCAVKVVDVMTGNSTQAGTVRRYALGVAADDTAYDAGQPGGSALFQTAAANTQDGLVGVTFSGSGSVTPTGGAPYAPTLTGSDWCTLQSVPASDGGNPWIAVAMTFSGSGSTTFPYVSLTSDGSTSTRDAWAAACLPGGRLTLRAKSGMDVVANPGSFTSTVAASGLPLFGLVFRTLSGGRTLLIPGDSIVKGTGSDIYGNYSGGAVSKGISGWANKLPRVVEARNTGVVNLGVGGAKASQYAALMKTAYAVFGASDVIYPPGTPNAETAGKYIAGMRAQAALLTDTIAWVRTNGLRLHITTPTPFSTEGSEAGSNSAFVAWVAKLRAMSSAGFSVIDFNAALSTGNAYTWASGTVADATTHPSQAGYDLMLAAAVARITA